MSLQESMSVQRKGKRKIMESSRQGVQINAFTCVSFRYFLIHTSLSIPLLCTFRLAPERQKSAAPKKGLREANVQRWEQKEQLPQNWGHSNGENKIQDNNKQMKLHAKGDDNEYLHTANIKSYEEKRKKLWGKRLISSFPGATRVFQLY